MSIIIPANSAVGGGFDVDNSVVFDRASGSKIYNTFGSTTNRRTYTVSLWLKKCNVSQEQNFVFAGDLGGSQPYYDARFNSDQTINWYLSSGGNLITTRKFTDPNAWYHMVLTVDTTQGTSSNRMKLYVNGVQQTSLSTASYPSQNSDTAFNVSGYESQYGAIRVNTPSYDGYMCEIVLIDGQALDPTSFGEFDSDSGVWKAIDVSELTFGNNGYYLDFKDSSDLGQDVSGNNNDFTLVNIASTDQSTDTCTNNFTTMNILDNYYAGATFSEGNLQVATANSGKAWNTSSIALSSGKWYFEAKNSASGGTHPGDTWNLIGISDRAPTSVTDLGIADYQYAIFQYDGKVYASSSTGVTYAASWATGDTIGCAIDLDNSKIYWSKNGAWGNGSGAWGSSTFNASTGAFSIQPVASTLNEYYFVAMGDAGVNVSKTWQFNFGSPFYAISSGNADGNDYGNFEYAVPSGFYSINTKNLAEYG